jgi:hypothetical protein
MQVSPAEGFPAGCFKIRNAEKGEYLYTGSSMLDGQRRYAVTWVGGGEVAGADAVWASHERKSH